MLYNAAATWKGTKKTQANWQALKLGQPFAMSLRRGSMCVGVPLKGMCNICFTQELFQSYEGDTSSLGQTFRPETIS
jgi:hypothetical protein